MTGSEQVSALKPVGQGERLFGGFDLALIWFGAAISIMEVWAGGLPALTGLGLGLGLVAIILGRLIGNGLMAAMAGVGAGTGLPTLVLTRPVFGVRGSYILAACNVLQLIGWTAWMLYVGYLYMDVLATMLGLPGGGAFPPMRIFWIVVLGALCIWWAAGGHRLWKRIQTASSVLLLLLTIAMTAAVLAKYDVRSLLAGPPHSGLAVLSGADIVIAMSVSWLPLVADYSRFARRPAAGAGGTFWGYLVGGSWMYAVGLLVALAASTSEPDKMVVNVMGGQGTAWAIAGVAMVLLSTVTTTFLDIYSTVISAQNLFPRVPSRLGVWVTGVLGILLASTLDAYAYQPFLTAIGAIFLPAFTVAILRYVLYGRAGVAIEELERRGGAYWFSGGFNWPAIAAWACGLVVYDWAQGFYNLNVFMNLFHHPITAQAWPYGASLPCIAVSAAVYLLLAALTGGLRKAA